MGFRGKASRFVYGEQNGFFWAAAQHDAYRRIGIPFVRRVIGCHTRPGLVLFLTGFRSRQNISFKDFCILLRETEVAQIKGEDRLVLSLQTDMNIFFEGIESLKLAQGWYCHEFGKRKANDVAIYETSSAKTQITGWYLCPTVFDRDQVQVRLPGRDDDPVVSIHYQNTQSFFNFENL